MLINFEDITLEELALITVGRIDGDKGVLIVAKEGLIHAKKNKGNKSHPKIFVGDVPFVDYLEKNYSHPIKAYHIAIDLRKQKQPLEYILERLEKYR